MSDSKMRHRDQHGVSKTMLTQHCAEYSSMEGIGLLMTTVDMAIFAKRYLAI